MKIDMTGVYLVREEILPKAIKKDYPRKGTHQ